MPGSSPSTWLAMTPPAGTRTACIGTHSVRPMTCSEAIMRSSFTVGATVMVQGMSTRIGELLWEHLSVGV